MHHRDRIPLTGTIALAACLILLLHDPASAETYQWTDKDGNVGFTDSLEKVPPQYRKSAKRLDETESKKSFQRVPDPPSRDNTMPADLAPDDPYAAWRSRLETARAELEELRSKRQKAKEEYDNMLFRRTKRSYAGDPDTEAKAASKISELDQQIRDKEYQITTAIPDEARQAGVPPNVLSR